MDDNTSEAAFHRSSQLLTFIQPQLISDLHKKVTPAVIVRQHKPWCQKDGVYMYFEGYPLEGYSKDAYPPPGTLCKVTPPPPQYTPQYAQPPLQQQQQGVGFIWMMEGGGS